MKVGIFTQTFVKVSAFLRSHWLHRHIANMDMENASKSQLTVASETTHVHVGNHCHTWNQCCDTTKAGEGLWRRV